MSKCGDNINSVHEMKDIGEDKRILVAYCVKCKFRTYIRKYEGRTDPKYSAIFARDTLQPNRNLYYKEFGKMNIA